MTAPPCGMCLLPCHAVWSSALNACDTKVSCPAGHGTGPGRTGGNCGGRGSGTGLGRSPRQPDLPVAWHPQPGDQRRMGQRGHNLPLHPGPGGVGDRGQLPLLQGHQRGRHRRGPDRLRGGAGSGSHRHGQGRQRPRPVLRVPAELDRLPGQLRAWHPHGRHHRRRRRSHRDVRRRRPRRPPRIGAGRQPRRCHRCVPGGGGHRLGGSAPQRPGAQHPGPQSLLRDREPAGLPGRPSGLRRRERLEARHRHRGGRRYDGTSHGSLRDPAVDPYVLSVGAANLNESSILQCATVASFSSRSSSRPVDVVAPGVSIESLRDPGSTIDLSNPKAVVNSRFFRGSGTSQAAAVTSGAAALLLQARPSLTPDQVKALLKSTASPLALLDGNAEGSGMIQVNSAAGALVPLGATQSYPNATGTGSMEQARGGSHVAFDGVQLTGEQDIMAHAWSGATWAPLSASAKAWDGGTWNGSVWTGSNWSGTSWAGTTWLGATWTGATWTGATWTGATWTGATWTGATWTGATWTGATWTGATWTAGTWW